MGLKALSTLPKEVMLRAFIALKKTIVFGRV
jgi:hypothetical protein